MNIFTIDMPTVLFFLFFGNLITAVLLALYPVDNFSRRTYGQFLIGKLFQSLAWILLAMRGSIPDVYSAYVGNSFLLAGLALEALAFINVDDPSKRWEIFYAAIVGLFVVVFWTLAKKPNQYVYVSSWFAAVVFLSVAILLLHSARKSALRYVMSAVYLFSCCVLIVRGINAFNVADFQLISHNAVQDVAFLATYSMMILSGANFLLLMREHSDQLLKEANHNLDNLARTDSLTGLANRRKFDEYLAFSILKSRRDAEPLTLILADVDYFKNYNDLYGHRLGDQCLVAVANSLKQQCSRSTDLIARYGGEEFVIILWNTNAEAACLISEAIRNNIMELAIPHADSDVSKYVTLSLGVFSAVPVSDKHNPDWYIVGADQRLYEAKHIGRNRSVCD